MAELASRRVWVTIPHAVGTPGERPSPGFEIPAGGELVVGWIRPRQVDVADIRWDAGITGSSCHPCDWREQRQADEGGNDHEDTNPMDSPQEHRPPPIQDVTPNCVLIGNPARRRCSWLPLASRNFCYPAARVTKRRKQLA